MTQEDVRRFLRRGPAAVNEIAIGTKLSRSNVGRCLRCLRRDGEVLIERDGPHYLYKLVAQ
jgi:predicted transcriptional regulator